MSHNFLIISYTGDPHGELKSRHLIKFLKQIKKYIPDSFIVVVDSKYTNEVEKYCNIFINQSDNFNQPHGTADVNKTKLGISVLKFLGIESFTKFAYDFWFNQTTFNKYIEWQNLLKNKKIVSAAWRLNDKESGMLNSMACNFGVYKTSAAEKLFDLDTVHYPIEIQLHQRAFSLFSQEDIYLYPHFMSVFDEENFDIFNSSGDSYSKNRLEKTSIE